MKPKEFIQRLKDLKIRRFEKNEYAKSIGGGTGLTGNLLDDWVFGITHGEYTKYKDIPSAVIGENSGWRKWTEGESRLDTFKAECYLTLRGDPENTSEQIEYNLYLDPVFTTATPK